MSEARQSASCSRASLAAKIAPWLLIIPSALIGVMLVEVFCWLFVPSLGAGLPGRDRRVIFFDGPSPVFKNNGDIFTYVPNANLQNRTVFLKDEGFTIEYDYRFKTNNLGLTQDADVLPERRSLLLLGDSFTEGQGAEPWFREVSPMIDRLGYQPVNGGVMGTGFQQWLKLAQYLAAKDIDIRKLVVFFISDDYHRTVWNIPPGVFECVSGSSLCRAENSYLYRLPPLDKMSSWIASVKAARGPLRPHLQLKLASLMPASYSAYWRLRQLIIFAHAEQGSHDAIAKLINTYGKENIAFVHLPQKDEIERGPNALGMKARGAIEEAGAKLIDGFELCKLTPGDYYPDDDHPNKEGYAKIATCAADVIKRLALDSK